MKEEGEIWERAQNGGLNSEIVRMKKETTEQLVEDFSKFLLQHILEPLDIEALQKNAERLRFISDTDFQESKFYHSVNSQFSQIITAVTLLLKRRVFD